MRELIPGMDIDCVQVQNIVRNLAYETPERRVLGRKWPFVLLFLWPRR